jgi:hypothetical protein
MTVIDALMMVETWFGLAVGIAINDKAKAGLAAVFTKGLPNNQKGGEVAERNSRNPVCDDGVPDHDHGDNE